ncbi:MAG: DUF6531 domain-containing protein [Oscillospiraceae bacterium]|nr:DUF6531 domain-containing protein [Oscillospiraceae bacterium]
MQGYSGAPARQYLRTCEEAMDAANAVVSSSAGRLPAIARPPLRRLPHLEADAVFRPGVTAGFESSANIVASSGHYNSAALTHITFGEEITGQLDQIYNAIDNAVTTNLRMPQTSTQVHLVTQMLRMLMPQLRDLLSRAGAITNRQSAAMLGIGGGGEGFEMQPSVADSYRVANEAILQNVSEDMRNYAQRARTHADHCDTQADNLRWQLNRMRNQPTPPNQTTAQARARTNTMNQLTSNINSLQSEAQVYRAEAMRLDQGADNLAQDILFTRRRFEHYVKECIDCDAHFAGEFQQLAGDMQQLAMQFEAIMSSFCPNAGIIDWSGLLDVKSQMSPADQELLSLLFFRAMLALAGVNNFCLFGLDPVNMSTGNFIYNKEDITIPGRFLLEFRRFYNSIGGTEGVVGAGWTHNYNIRLEDKESAVHVIFGDGRVETYNCSKEDGYISPLESDYSLQKTDNGWELSTSTNEVHKFDKIGLLQSICDANDNAVTLDYKDTLLSKVSTLGGSLKFLYDKNNRIMNVSDHTGREVKLEYSGVLLSKVVHPSGAEHKYGYDSYGNLSTIINPLGVEVIKNKYDGNGRLVGQSFADGGESSVNYENEITTTTEQNGNEIKYERDSKYRTIRTIYSDSEERFEYNDQNKRTKHIDRNGNETTFEYDEYGQMFKITDALGYKTKLEYNGSDLVQVSREDDIMAKLCCDDNGNVIEVKDALERISKIEYDGKGQPVKVIAPDESVTMMEYDECGNIVAITDALGAVTMYEYDKLNRPIATTDGNSNRTKFEYNATGDISKVTNADGKKQTFEYNANGKVTSMVDFDESTITQEYNNMGKPCRMVDQEGNETILEYDLMWNVSKQIDANGNETVFEYNKLNRLEKVINAKGTEVRFEYDPNGNRTKVYGAKGEEVTLSYDSLNRLTEVTEPDGAKMTANYDCMGQVTRVTDAMGYETNFIYDKMGQKTSEIDPTGRKLKYTYNALGQIATVTGSIGRTVEYEYLPGGLLASVTQPDGKSEKYTYDANKNIISKESQDGYTLSYEYNCLNQITKISSSTGQIKTHTYDAVGNVTSITDANSNTTRYIYSPAGNLISVIDPLGNKSEYDYDRLGNLVEVKQFAELSEAMEINKQNSKLRITKYDWDEIGQVEKITDALGNIEKYTYDELGNVTSKLDKDGFLTKYAYNITNQLEEVVYADGNTVKLSYNPLKQLTEIRDWLGITSIDVDELGRAKKVRDHNGNEVEYTFGTEGEQRSIKYPDGKVAEYIYDDLLRLKTLIDGNNKVDYLYDNNGRLSDKTFSSGVSTKYMYNDMGLLSELAHSDKDGILDRYTYSYDNMINKSSIEKYRRGLEEESGNYSYSYDALSRLTKVHKDGQQIKSFDYDEFGNRSQMIDNNVKTNYTYNALNQLISTNNTIGIEQHFNYDKRGNLTQILENGKVKNSYEFGALNRLTKATNSAGQSASYDYNSFGFRVGKHVTDNLNPTKNINYVLDLTKQYHNLLQMSDDKQTQCYTWGHNIAFADDNAYLQDELGSPLRYIDSTGNTIGSYGYGEFGDDLYGNQGAVQPFGYTGYIADSIAGTYFAQAREYLPSIGRFSGEDIVKQGNNWYAYCGGNPLKYIDPDGQIYIVYDQCARQFVYTSNRDVALQFVNVPPGSDATPSGVFIESTSPGRVVYDLRASGQTVVTADSSAFRVTTTGKVEPVVRSPRNDNGVTISQTGNNIIIEAYFYFPTAGVIFNRDRIPDNIWTGDESNLTYAQIFLQGVEEHWSGNFGNYQVTVYARRAMTASDGIQVNIRNGYGVSNLRVIGGAANNWSNSNRGTITMFRGDLRSETTQPYSLSQFMWVSAHEFGHALGIADASRFENSEGFESIMNAFGMLVQERDITMLLQAWETGNWQIWPGMGDRLPSTPWLINECVG